VHPDAIAASHAIFGLVQKLSLLGVPGVTQGTAATVTWLYTLVLVGLAALGARASGAGASGARDSSGRLSLVLVWLTLLHLASLRSPFTPDVYAQFPLLWIAVLLLAGMEWRGWRLVALIGVILVANLTVPTVPIMPVPALLGITLVIQSLFLAFAVAVLLAQQRGDGGGAVDGRLMGKR